MLRLKVLWCNLRASYDLRRCRSVNHDTLVNVACHFTCNMAWGIYAATHCNTLQHTQKNCNTCNTRVDAACCLDHEWGIYAATHCNTLQHTATHCNALQHTATHTVVQCAPVCHMQDDLLDPLMQRAQHTAIQCNTVRYSAPYCITVCCSGEHVGKLARSMMHRAQHTSI